MSNLTAANQTESLSNVSYRNFIFRQYFIDLLNISQSSLIRSMAYEQQHRHAVVKRYVDQNRRKRSIDESIIFTPIYTLQSNSCTKINNQVQTTFIWFYPLKSIDSIELIFHIDQTRMNQSSIPLNLYFKQSNTHAELLNIETEFKFDIDRDFFSVNIYHYLLQISRNLNITIEARVEAQTCENSQTYLIVSSISNVSKPTLTKKLNPTWSFDLRQLFQGKSESSSTTCQLRKIRIDFEELGLAYLIIRPKEYFFTYCDGPCSSLTDYRQSLSLGTSLHALFQFIAQKKYPHLPQPNCTPTQFADDHFLLRSNDGSIELHPIKDFIVKQCACL